MAPAPSPIRVNRAPILTLWATVVAERLGEHFDRSGHVVMHKPPLVRQGAPGTHSHSDGKAGKHAWTFIRRKPRFRPN